MRLGAWLKHSTLVLTAGTALAAAGCAGDTSEDPPYEGPGVSIDMAALNLEGVGDVVWDLQVDNGDDEVVWQRRVTSSTYGDSAGSASYIGPCDADPDVDNNTVKVWVVGVYTADISAADAGSFNSGSTADAGAVTGTSVPFQNPTTPSSPLSRDFDCVENGDVFVQFDVALMRPAQQGFFDIAVNFNNIFCSAKLDCAYEGPTADPSDDIEIQLLHQPGGGRGRTAVLGFACTAGIGDVTTELVMSDISYECFDNAGSFAYLIPDADGNVDLSFEDVSDPAPLFAAAVHRGSEQLSAPGGDANKVYWNVLLGYSDMNPTDAGGDSGECWLTAEATALDGDDPDAATPATPSGMTYPVVMWSIQLTDANGDRACSQHPLDLSSTIDLATFTPYSDEVMGAFYTDDTGAYEPSFGWYIYP